MQIFNFMEGNMFNIFDDSKVGDEVIVSTGPYDLYVKGTITKINKRYVYVKFISEHGSLEQENKYSVWNGKCLEKYALSFNFIRKWDETLFTNYNKPRIQERKRFKNEQIIRKINLNDLTDEQLEQIAKIIKPEEIDA